MASTSNTSYKESPAFLWLACLALLCLSIWMLAATRNSFAQYRVIGKPDNVRDTITIEGEGKVNAQPNIAETTMGVLSQGADIGVLQTENTRKMNALIAAIKTSGVADKDIQTQQYSISPRYDYTNGAQKLVGYEVGQQVRVKIRDLTKVGALLTSAAQLGANQVSGLAFTFDDPSSLEQEARKKAIENAREKADELARSLGVDVVRVVSFNESNVGTPRPMMNAYAMEGKAVDQAMTPSIEAGSTDLTSHVSVTYEIR